MNPNVRCLMEDQMEKNMENDVENREAFCNVCPRGQNT